MKINVDVINQKLKISTNIKNLVSGSQKFVRFFFNLDSDWNGLTVFAQFKQGENAYNPYLDEECSVYLPSEITEGECTLTLYGVGGDVKATTNYLLLAIDKNILVANAQSTDISRSLYDQLINQVNELIASPAGSGGDVGTELRNIRIGFDGTEYNSAGLAVRSQIESAVKGINILLDATALANYNSDFNNLPNNIETRCSVDSSSGSISNAPYSGVLNGLIITFGSGTARGDGDTQLFIPENGGAIWYRQYNTRNGVSGWKEWSSIYDNAQQCRDGVNAQYGTYGGHIYAYKKEGTFYVTPRMDMSDPNSAVRWSDLPTNDNAYIINNSRYGSYIMQTAVDAYHPDMIYRRFISNNPNDDQSQTYSWTGGISVRGIDKLLDNSTWAGYGNNFNNLPNDAVIPCSMTVTVTNNVSNIANAPYTGIMNGLIVTYGRTLARNDGDTQMYIPENGGAIWYRQYYTRNNTASWGAWTTVYENAMQCREGVNALNSTYSRHVYSYKKDGTFYVTPVNWDDLPTSDAPYVMTNTRYGSYIMQTAVKSSDPTKVYRRFISNNPSDDVNPATAYTIADNGYGWELCEGIDITQFRARPASDSPSVNLTVGLPVLYLSNCDLSNMKKKIEGTDDDDIRTADFQYEISLGNWVTGKCTVKLQGSSSVAYTKKNYTIKFDSAMDVGWGSQRKYCFKANYVDNSGALNVCGAKLWSEIVANRGTHPAITHNAPNNGAMDGFPCIIMLNGKFHGLYTWNIPKDKWAFGMGSSASEYIVTAEQHSDPTKFRTTTDFAKQDGKALDFEIEYKQSDDIPDDTVKASLNTMLTKISSLTGQNPPADAWDYLDYGTAIDYMIFSALISNTDGVDKNFILTTYDGVKWWLNAYDLDSIMGNFWTGGSYYAADDSDARNKTSFLWLAGTSRLFNVLWNNHKSDVIARYNALRAGILSEEHIYMTLYNFCVRIPQVIIDEDNRKYPLKPGTSTETISRIMEWYRQRCAFIDAEIADTQESVDAELQAFKNYLGV